jgi:hypothetical protein
MLKRGNSEKYGRKSRAKREGHDVKENSIDET